MLQIICVEYDSGPMMHLGAEKVVTRRRIFEIESPEVEEWLNKYKDDEPYLVRSIDGVAISVSKGG